MGAQQDTYNSCLSRIDRVHLTALIVSYSTPAEGVSGWGPECIVPQPPSLGGGAPRGPPDVPPMLDARLGIDFYRLTTGDL